MPKAAGKNPSPEKGSRHSRWEWAAPAGALLGTAEAPILPGRKSTVPGLGSPVGDELPACPGEGSREMMGGVGQ
ncbi:hypothetical protein N7539_007644 [Penicillium diatomitis]|uniref:Uncharacterized protein n=1 Tax=Penicillium diatomitis TaxID=2819901 RepID=A0A9X0BP36_9EURO|nr:uncharacterized protein N7539_007644 [Penicillium diatomitis]KAJ5477500.1 hypothetical protein N7539_007644 [Penicillium diatomitis]